MAVFFLISALCINLANRTVHLHSLDHGSFTSSAPKAKVQHLDKDAFGWSAAPELFAFFNVALSQPVIVWEEECPPSRELDRCLYNRPPPRS